MNHIKKLYLHFVIVFSVLFLSSSAFADPRDWWSIKKITGVFENRFTADYSWVKIGCYVMVALFIVLVANQPLIKMKIKTLVRKINYIIQSSLHTVRAFFS